MSTLALDPGIRGCGVAVFSDQGTLMWCGYVRSQSKVDDLYGALVMARMVQQDVRSEGTVLNLAVEWPQVYAGGKQKGDANDLIALAAVVASVCTLYPQATVTRYKPRDWKGTVPKEVIQARILGDTKRGVRGRLGGMEIAMFEACVCPPSLLHNTLDAIGIGLHFHGRL